MSDYLQFVYPAWLYLLPFLLVLAFLRKRRGADGSIAYPTAKFISVLARPSESLAGRIGALLMLLSAMSLIIALARPQLVNEREVREVSGIDIIIALDLSGSMNRADMVMNGRLVPRLDLAKIVINEFIHTRPDDRIGVVGFAGKTKSLSPLTLDHPLLENIVRRSTTAGQFNSMASTIQQDGTAIGSAIAASASRLESRKDTKSKIIILVTDGANNTGVLSPDEAASAAAKLGIRIYTIGVGSNRRQGDMRENEYDEAALKKISSITGGEFFRASDTQKFKQAFTSIDKLEKTEAKTQTIFSVKDFFIYFLIASTVLLTLGLAMQVLRPNPAP